jgi:hypothetical protein
MRLSQKVDFLTFETASMKKIGLPDNRIVIPVEVKLKCLPLHLTANHPPYGVRNLSSNCSPGKI